MEETLQDEGSRAASAAAASSSRSGRGAARRTWRGSGHLAARAHAAGWWCQRQKDSFEKRAAKLEKRVAASTPKEGESRKVGFTETSRTLLEMRAVAKTLDSAKWWGCDCANKADYKTTTFQSIVAIGASESPCFGKAKEILEGVAGKSEAEQSEAFGRATAVMLSTSDTCEPVEEDLDSSEAEDEQEQAREAEAAAKTLANKIGDPSAAAVSESLIEGEDADVEGAGQPSSMLEVASFTQQVEQQWASRRALVGSRLLDLVVIGLLAFVALLLAVLVCTAVVTMIIMVLGIVFCIIRKIILGIISLFKDMGNIKVNRCVSVLWRQMVGWGTKDEEHKGYFFKKGSGMKVISVGCAIPLALGAFAAFPR